ncbi:unnamed protein product, partial [Didymodactylos carnosus]
MYTVVRINNHEPLKDRYKHENETPLSDADVGKRWLKKCDGGGRLQKQSAEKSTLNLQYTVTNGPYTNAPSNPVLQAFVNAYNNHEDLILCPDDIWLVICISYAQYVNANAEKLRHIFVDHQGKKELTVFEPPGKDERDWTDFFGAMKQEIEQNVKGDIVSVLTANYSTTGKVEAILSNACIMDTFQSYFEYTRVMTMCGIRNVKFMGTLDDWKMLKNKTEQMKAYSEGEFYNSPLSSTPQRMKNDLSDNISRVNESTTTIIPTENKRKTICILGDSLLRDLDPKIISDKKHLVKIKTHGGEKLSKLNDKVKTKYEHLLKESNTVIFVCGTNSISDHDVNECIREAETLIKTTKSINSNINICMTTVPFRSCKLNQGGFDKIASYNKQLKQICQEQNVELIRINFERELAEELSIPGFLHYRNDFSRKSQGIVTYVRHDINHSLIACSNEAMAMLLEVQVSAYFLLQNAKKDVPLILVGDFNVNTAAPPGGLQQILELFSIRRAFSVSTTHKNTKIDNVFYSNEWEQPSTKVFPELGKSPHFLLEAKFNLQSKSKQK